MVRVPRNQKVQVVPSENTPIVLSEFNGAAEGEETTDIVGLSPDQRSDKLERMYRPPALDTPILVARDAPISTLDPNRFANFPEPKAKRHCPHSRNWMQLSQMSWKR